MKIYTLFISIIILSILFPFTITGQEKEDKYLWLEDIESERSMEWVKEKNKNTIEMLQSRPEFKEINENILKIYNSKERIPYPNIRGKYIYNFWQDDKYKRGIGRRTSLTEYLKDPPKWETVIDIDLLCEQEGEKWAYNSASFLYPEFDICMLNLSRGGSDAVVMREFDLKKKNFVKDGFYVPQAKGSVSWIDSNTLLISTDFGEGTLTTSGYPRIAKIWKRGTPLKEAKTVFEGKEKDIGIFGGVQNSPERQYVIIFRSITFYTSNVFIMENDKLIKLEIPEDADFHGFFKNQMLVELKSDWVIKGRTYKQGALISVDYDKFLEGDRNFEVIFQPGERSSLESVGKTKNLLLLNTSTNVSSELHKYLFKNGKWMNEKLKAPDYGAITIISTDRFSDQYFFLYENFLVPSSLYYVSRNGKEMQKIKSLPDFFDSSKYQVKQLEAASKDGTRIPYFIISSKKTRFDSLNPTLLYGYGGFEISLQPGYSATIGSAWLERGGIYVVANIRGGGEFGPKWHQAALKENRQRVYDDFIAVSEDLIKRKITSPKHLGIMGGSNGGLLVGVAFTQRPDLYNAVVCSAPLLDMKRYNKLLAGASWMGEFGNPDIPEEWEYIRKYSPYQNLTESKKYPEVFFTTTTRDDRVHPGHARKMAAKMEEQNHDFLYFENTEGGHGAGVTNEQRAYMTSLEFVYLLKMLK